MKWCGGVNRRVLEHKVHVKRWGGNHLFAKKEGGLGIFDAEQGNHTYFTLLTFHYLHPTPFHSPNARCTFFLIHRVNEIAKVQRCKCTCIHLESAPPQVPVTLSASPKVAASSSIHLWCNSAGHSGVPNRMSTSSGKQSGLACGARETVWFLFFAASLHLRYITKKRNHKCKQAYWGRDRLCKAKMGPNQRKSETLLSAKQG